MMMVHLSGARITFLWDTDGVSLGVALGQTHMLTCLDYHFARVDDVTAWGPQFAW